MLTPNSKIHFPPSVLKFYLEFLILLITFLFSSTGWTATDCTQVTQIPQIECEALLDFYNSTGGPNWRNNTGWNETNAPCDWHGISCESGHVTQLRFKENRLNGVIPDSLGNLSQLSSFYVYRAHLSGPLPDSLGNLSQLSSFSLIATQLSGQIPEWLANLNQLSHLDLVTNQLSVPIPEWLGNLSQLSFLRLSNNQLSGTIPDSLGNLSQLSSLGLSNNQLSGPIPNSLGSLSQLNSLDLASNQLSGPIPESLENLSQLRQLELYNNQLSGPIPEWLGNLSQLSTLFLYDNQLCGNIPNTLISLSNLRSNCQLNNNYLTVNPNSSDLITFLNQNCRNWKEQNQPLTNCITDQHYTLTLQTTAEGTVTASTGLDDGIQCPTNCSENYLEDSVITLTAQAANDFQFIQWSGDCSGSDPLLTLTITDNFNCTATFEPQPQEITQHHLNITSSGEGQGTVTLQVNNEPLTNCYPNCTQILPHHSQITLTAQANDFPVSWVALELVVPGTLL